MSSLGAVISTKRSRVDSVQVVATQQLLSHALPSPVRTHASQAFLPARIDGAAGDARETLGRLGGARELHSFLFKDDKTSRVFGRRRNVLLSVG